MATEQKRYGTLDLTMAVNGILVTAWDDTPLYTVEHEDRVDGKGAIKSRDAISGRRIDLAGDVTGGGNVDTVRANLDRFLAAFRTRDDYFTLFTDRRILCGLSELSYSYPKGMQLARATWSLSLVSTRPTWEATSASTGLIQVAAAGSTVTASMPANAGVAPAYPQITITNQGTSFSGQQVRIINQSTQAEFTIDGLELNNGQSIVVDMDARRLGDGISVPTMPSGISGEYWELSPGSTQTLLVVLSAPMAGGTLDFDVSFRAQYWSA